MHPASAKHVSTHMGSMWEIAVRGTGLLPYLHHLVSLFHLTSLLVLFSGRHSTPSSIWLNTAEMTAHGKTPTDFSGRWIVPWVMACLDGSGEVWGELNSESIPSITNMPTVSALTREFTRQEWCLLLSPIWRSSYLTTLVSSLQFSLRTSTHESLQISAKPHCSPYTFIMANIFSLMACFQCTFFNAPHLNYISLFQACSGNLQDFAAPFSHASLSLGEWFASG